MTSDKNKHTENKKGVFLVPPEAPIFKPSSREFTDPLEYISKVRPMAEKYGICKIIPPSNWIPPFALDVDKIRFTPRIQRLNELEARVRIKLNFLKQILKFWEIQGTDLKIPTIGKITLDLYMLHKVVNDFGGYANVNKSNKWSDVARRLDFRNVKNIESTLKNYYRRILHPYDVFRLHKSKIQNNNSNKSRENDNCSDLEKNTCDSKKSDSCSNKKCPNYGDNKKCSISENKNEGNSQRIQTKKGEDKLVNFENIDVITIIDSEEENEKTFQNIKSKNTELRRLQFYNAGVKMAGYTKQPFDYVISPDDSKTTRFRNISNLSKCFCVNCRRGDVEESLLMCEDCNDNYHTFCLLPPLFTVPNGKWLCPKCIGKTVSSKPTQAYGFEQADREYSLQQFGQMADEFKSDYFNMPGYTVPTDVVEQEFWRILSSIDEDVTVEYAADLHTMDHGSGFPTHHSLNLLAGDKEYVDSKWNLNNLPILKGSVLKYIDDDVSGVKVPWMYVGMCFATFCWHNEDHWAYSINYLHWGEPKTWYGVPGHHAEALEKTMMSAAPELFESQPDLLHQLVTIVSPNLLMDAGIPVYRMDQSAREFIVTFPRAYHCGFNQGYNFAEAVNFAPSDWIKHGRESVNHYMSVRRFCVFSHDELICKMALEPNKLDISIATEACKDMKAMIENEMKLIDCVVEWGIGERRQVFFELCKDDERLCFVCKTTCFLSAFTCKCNNERKFCLRHCISECQCPQVDRVLLYRYTMDELSDIFSKLEKKVNQYHFWLGRVESAFDESKPKTLEFVELKQLFIEGKLNMFPKSDLFTKLCVAIENSEKCLAVINRLDLNKIRTRQSSDLKVKVSVEEMKLFCNEINNLPCILKEADVVKEFLNRAVKFETESQEILEQDIGSVSSTDVNKCIDDGLSLHVFEVNNLHGLQKRLKQIKWLEEVWSLKDNVNTDDLQHLLNRGLDLTSDRIIEKYLDKIHDMLVMTKRWENRAKKCLKSKSFSTIREIEYLLTCSNRIKVFLPTKNKLREILKCVREWIDKVNRIHSNNKRPCYRDIEEIVSSGKSVHLLAEKVKPFEAQLNAADLWKNHATKSFLEKKWNSFYALIELLSPRVLKSLEIDEKYTVFENDFNKTYVELQNQEIDFIKMQRNNNLTKTENNDRPFCICKGKRYDFMIRCELCYDWYHIKCINTANQTTKSDKFLCMLCRRTQRPTLKNILSLLISYQKLNLTLPEGSALQCLTERAMDWQERAKKLLNSEELHFFNKQLLQNEDRVSLNMQLKKLKNASEKSKSYLNAASHRSQPSTSKHFDLKWIEPNSQPPVLEDSRTNAETEVLSVNKKYHFKPTNKPEYDKNEFDSFYRQNIQSHILNESLRQNLEELILEGDLIEVSLPEKEHIWKLLQLPKQKDFTESIVYFENVDKQKSEHRSKKTNETIDLTNTGGNVDVRKSKKIKMDPNVGFRHKKIKKENGEGRDVMFYDEPCSADVCTQPSGMGIDWVQCDGPCNQWYHMCCIGLSKKELANNDQFLCLKCS